MQVWQLRGVGRRRKRMARGNTVVGAVRFSALENSLLDEVQRLEYDGKVLTEDGREDGA